MQKSLHKNRDAFERASPYGRVVELLEENSDFPESVPPPFFLAHGEYDSLIPYEDSLEFFNYLQELRKRYQEGTDYVKDVYISLPNAQHSFNILCSPRSYAFGDAVCHFLKEIWDSKYIYVKPQPKITTSTHIVAARL